MTQAFVIVLREGFESFLLVAMISTYLHKTGKGNLLPAVVWGIIASVFVSAGTGFILLNSAGGPLVEGVMGIISAVFITVLVVHMWRTAAMLKADMEKKLSEKIDKKRAGKAMAAVFLFTVMMISREGMETAMLLFQVHEPNIILGVGLGLLAAAIIAVAWLKVGALINLKLFFQVTSVFLLLFVGQVVLYSFHEFTEAGIFPNSEALHIATEPYSPDGLYGKWVSLGMVIICVAWLLIAALKDAVRKGQKISV